MGTHGSCFAGGTLCCGLVATTILLNIFLFIKEKNSMQWIYSHRVGSIIIIIIIINKMSLFNIISFFSYQFILNFIKEYIPLFFCKYLLLMSSVIKTDMQIIINIEKKNI